MLVLLLDPCSWYSGEAEGQVEGGEGANASRTCPARTSGESRGEGVVVAHAAERGSGGWRESEGEEVESQPMCGAELGEGHAGTAEKKAGELGDTGEAAGVEEGIKCGNPLLGVATDGGGGATG